MPCNPSPKAFKSGEHRQGKMHFLKIHEPSFVCFQYSYVSMTTPRSVEFRNEIRVYSLLLHGLA